MTKILMIKALATTTAITLAFAMAAPSYAQLMGGQLGGGLGGGLGGTLGGGMPMGGIAGNAGINSTLDASRDTVHTTNRAHGSVRAPKTPKLAAPKAGGGAALVAASVSTKVVAAAPRITTTIRGNTTVIDRDVAHIVFVPAIPNLAVRRSAIIASGIAPVAYDDAPVYIDTQYQVLRDDLRGSGVDVVKRGQQIVLEMPSDVTFAFDKHDIQPRFRPVLDVVAQTLTKYPATYVDVDGHTDAIGSVAYNQVLSEKRAFNVADYLSARAVMPARLHVEGFGKSEPIASNATVTGRATNRRVEIILTPYVG